MAKSKTKEEQAADRAMKAIAKWLEIKGWHILVVGLDRIEGTEQKYKYRLIVGFLGREPKVKK